MHLPVELVEANTVDISEYAQFGWYEPCWAWMAGNNPDKGERLCRVVGVAHHIGQAMCLLGQWLGQACSCLRLAKLILVCSSLAKLLVICSRLAKLATGPTSPSCSRTPQEPRATCANRPKHQQHVFQEFLWK